MRVLVASESRESENYHRNICFPENFDCISRSASRSFQSSNQFLIGYRPKNSIKLLDDRNGLDNGNICDIIISSHGVATSLTTGASLAMSSPVASALNIQVALEGFAPTRLVSRPTPNRMCLLFHHSAITNKRGVVLTHHSSSYYLGTSLKTPRPTFSKRSLRPIVATTTEYPLSPSSLPPSRSALTNSTVLIWPPASCITTSAAALMVISWNLVRFTSGEDRRLAVGVIMLATIRRLLKLGQGPHIIYQGNLGYHCSHCGAKVATESVKSQALPAQCPLCGAKFPGQEE